MTAPFRKPSDNPHINRAIKALKQAQACLKPFERDVNADQRQSTISAFVWLASLLSSGPTVHSSTQADTAALDVNHKTIWTCISEARTLLAKAGFDVGPNEETIWGRKHDVEAAQRDIQRLQALLPGVDFTPQEDDAVEAYLRSQRSSSVLKYLLIFLLFLVLPVAALILAGIYW